MILNGEDGIDFVNIYSKGNTELGRWLSNFTRAPVDIPIHGKFESLEGYFYYLKTGDKRLQKEWGYGAKELGKSLPILLEEKSEQFKIEFRRGLDIKLKTYRDWFDKLVKCELPLCHYYEYGGKRVDAEYNWIVEHIEMRRKQMKDHLKKKKKK